MMYVGYSLSSSEVEDIPVERGIDIGHEAIGCDAAGVRRCPGSGQHTPARFLLREWKYTAAQSDRTTGRNSMAHTVVGDAVCSPHALSTDDAGTPAPEPGGVGCVSAGDRANLRAVHAGAWA